MCEVMMAVEVVVWGQGGGGGAPPPPPPPSLTSFIVEISVVPAGNLGSNGATGVRPWGR